MKYKIAVLAFVCSSIMSFTFLEKMNFRPPGTVEIVDNFFFDAREICNSDWNEYLSYLEQNDGIESESYKQAQPDNGIWVNDSYDLSPYKEEYFSNPAYDSYPVVGVSHQQAVDYCKWRTMAVKTKMVANNIGDGIEFEYRLPSRTEWELVANMGYSKKSEKLISKQLKIEANKEVSRERLIYNMKTVKDENEQLGKIGFIELVPGPSRSYLPNKLGVYNIYGNVAEMIQEPGVAMGGSFQDYYEDIVPTNSSLKYNQPSNWLGFRCVCEVK